MVLKWYEFYLKEVRGKVVGKQYYMADSFPFIIWFLEPTYLYPVSEKGNKEPVTVYSIEKYDGKVVDLIADEHLQEPDVGDLAKAETYRFPRRRYLRHGDSEKYAKFLPMIERIAKTES